MLPTISIGPLVVPSNGLVIIIGLWIVLTVVERSARKLSLDAETTYTLAAVSLATGFVGARLTFVFLHWSAFQSNLIGIVWPLTSGYDPWGGLLVALAAGYFYGRAKRLPLPATLDALAPGLVTAFLVISLSDLLAGPGYGLMTDIPWALDVYGIDRHPVQIYEMLVAGLALISWRVVEPRRRFDGQLFLVTVAVYSSGRLFVDAYRANAWLTSSGIHVLQVLSLIALITSLVLLARKSSSSTPEIEVGAHATPDQ